MTSHGAIEAAVPKNTEMVTKFGLTLFNGNLFNLSKLNLSQNYVKKTLRGEISTFYFLHLL